MKDGLHAEGRFWWLATVLLPPLTGIGAAGFLLARTGLQPVDLPIALLLLLAIPVLTVNTTALLLWRFLPQRRLLPIRRPGSRRIFLHLTPHTYGAFTHQSPLVLGRALHREMRMLLQQGEPAHLVMVTSLHIDPVLLQKIPGVREVRQTAYPAPTGLKKTASRLFIALLTWPVYVWINPGSYRKAMDVYLRPRRRLEIRMDPPHKKPLPR